MSSRRSRSKAICLLSHPRATGRDRARAACPKARSAPQSRMLFARDPQFSARPRGRRDGANNGGLVRWLGEKVDGAHLPRFPAVAGISATTHKTQRESVTRSVSSRDP